MYCCADPSERLRVVLVGAGRWGSNIARVLKELEAEGLVDLYGVADADLGRAAELSKNYGFKVAEKDPAAVDGDAYLLAVPIDSLYSTALKVLDRARCIFVEKPAATSTEEVTRLLDEVRSRGVVDQVGYIVRFDLVSVELAKLVNQLKPYALRFRRLSRRPPHMRRYPVTLDLMSHDIDLALHILGAEGFNVIASYLSPVGGPPQRALALVEYGDLEILFEADGILPVKVREVDLLSESALAKADFVSRRILIYSEAGTTELRLSGTEPLKEELRTFIERCRGVDLKAPTLEDALKVLTVLEELHRLARA
jgi:predicted dehydrogenase